MKKLAILIVLLTSAGCATGPHPCDSFLQGFSSEEARATAQQTYYQCMRDYNDRMAEAWSKAFRDLGNVRW